MRNSEIGFQVQCGSSELPVSHGKRAILARGPELVELAELGTDFAACCAS